MPNYKSDEATLRLINARLEQVKQEMTEEELRPLIRKIIREVLHEELGRDVRHMLGYKPEMEYKS